METTYSFDLIFSFVSPLSSRFFDINSIIWFLMNLWILQEIVVKINHKKVFPLKIYNLRACMICHHFIWSSCFAFDRPLNRKLTIATNFCHFFQHHNNFFVLTWFKTLVFPSIHATSQFDCYPLVNLGLWIGLMLQFAMYDPINHAISHYDYDPLVYFDLWIECMLPFAMHYPE